MDFQEFYESLEKAEAPESLSDMLRAMWYEGKGNWDKAHDIAQEDEGPLGSWIHAYLHRKEGDNWNANYWYRRAGRTMPDTSLEQEWKDIVSELLQG